MDERKFAVLKAIIEDYVTTQEPIGSKSLVERHSLKVSPATVRNEMAVLEDEGLITQPHTSAGPEIYSTPPSGGFLEPPPGPQNRS